MASYFRYSEAEIRIPEQDITVILATVAAIKKRRTAGVSSPTNEEVAVIEAAIRAYRTSTQSKLIIIRPPVNSMWKMAARIRM